MSLYRTPVSKQHTWLFLLSCSFPFWSSSAFAQQQEIPTAPVMTALAKGPTPWKSDTTLLPTISSSLQDDDLPDAPMPAQEPNTDLQQPKATDGKPQQPVGADGKPIRPQTGRIFGIFPNFVAVSGGTKPKPAGWKTDFHLANKQAYDYSSFGFLLISSGLAYAQDSHPSLSTVNGGDAPFWAYLWRGFLDKTDGTYQGTFLFPALLHEDTRYYAMGTGPAKKRLLHAVASVVVAHDYNQKPIFNLAGQLGRAGAQAVSTTYYPAGSENFGVLAEKFAYANMRNVIYAVIREFSPDAQAFVHSRHERKSNEDAAAAKQGE